jgi:hypothetical protein
MEQERFSFMPPPKSVGRPAHEVTEKKCKYISMMIVAGSTQEQIAQGMPGGPISPSTLKSKYKWLLKKERATVIQIAKGHILTRLYDEAVENGSAAHAAQLIKVIDKAGLQAMPVPVARQEKLGKKAQRLMDAAAASADGGWNKIVGNTGEVRSKH